MVFNRRRKTKVQWEKQVTRARKETKDQFDRLANDQPSAVSDLSETVYTNGSEVDAIGIFGKNDAYGRKIGDSFTLGNETETDFEDRDDYDPVSGPTYNIAQLAEEDTYDDTFGDDMSSSFGGRGGEHRFIDDVHTEDESEYTGDRWGAQGSYRVRGLENASDMVGQSHSRSQGHSYTNELEKKNIDYPRNESFLRSSAETSRTYEHDLALNDDESEKNHQNYRKYLNDYDIPEPTRQSPIVVLYDTILSHPLLTCISFPCIPCLALYVKSSEKTSTVARPRKRTDVKGKLIGHRRVNTTRSRDESTFATYNANQRRFDDISEDPRDNVYKNDARGGGGTTRHKHRTRSIRSMDSKNSEFSEINGVKSKFGKFGLKSGFKDSAGRGSSRGVKKGFTQMQSGGRPFAHGMQSPDQTEFSKDSSRRGYSTDGDLSYDPVAYDNVGDGYPSAYDSTTMDNNDNLVDVPQGQWNYGSVDERPIHRNSSNLSVGWKDTVTDHVYTTDSATFDRTESNGSFLRNISDTFSTYTGRDTADHSNNSFINQGGLWNIADSFSGRFSRRGDPYSDNRMSHAIGTIEESTIGSDFNRDERGRYHGQ